MFLLIILNRYFYNFTITYTVHYKTHKISLFPLKFKRYELKVDVFQWILNFDFMMHFKKCHRIINLISLHLPIMIGLRNADIPTIHVPKPIVIGNFCSPMYSLNNTEWFTINPPLIIPSAKLMGSIPETGISGKRANSVPMMIRYMRTNVLLLTTWRSAIHPLVRRPAKSPMEYAETRNTASALFTPLSWKKDLSRVDLTQRNM